jgi:hypothetical protein
MSYRCGLVLRVVALAGLALGGCGCGGPGQAVVFGKVTYEGKVLNTSGVVISFLGQDGRPVTAEVAPDGSYTASGVPLGKAKVSVYWAAPPGQDLASLLKPQGFDPKGPPPVVDEQAIAARMQSPIPAHYGDPATSELTFDIGKGHNSYDVDLKGRP